VAELIGSLLFGSGTSVLITTKIKDHWSWEPIYDGGEPNLGVVYDLKDSNGKYFRGIINKRANVGFRLHYFGWQRKWDEYVTARDLAERVSTRGSHTRNDFLSVTGVDQLEDYNDWISIFPFDIRPKIIAGAKAFNSGKLSVWKFISLYPLPTAKRILGFAKWLNAN